MARALDFSRWLDVNRNFRRKEFTFIILYGVKRQDKTVTRVKI